MRTKDIISSGINGLIAGLILILLLYIKRDYHLPNALPIIIDFVIVIAAIIFTVKRYRKNNITNSDKIALNLGHITYILTITPILMLRLLNGWFKDKNMIIVIIAVTVIILFGRFLSHIIISSMKKKDVQGRMNQD